jgi:hypothetical protein
MIVVVMAPHVDPFFSMSSTLKVLLRNLAIGIHHNTNELQAKFQQKKINDQQT